MYKELLLFPAKLELREQVIYPDDARKLVAKATNTAPISPVIFGRDGEAKTLQGKIYLGGDRRNEGVGSPPLIIFDGGRGFVRLYGVGPRGADLLMANAMQIYSAMEKFWECSVRTELKGGDCELTMSEPTLYSVRRLVMAKKPGQLSHFFNVSAVDRAEEIKKEVVRSLIATAGWLDDELETANLDKDRKKLKSQIPHDDAFVFDVLEGESVPVEIKPGIPCSAFKNLTFCTNLDLNGPWAAGKLRSRGYGLIRRRLER